MLSLSSFTLLLIASQFAVSQFVPTPTGFTKKTGYAGIDVRYKQVPAGICEQNPHVKSYSGYADVAEDQHIFWWFFEARNGNANSTAPLSVWINGGPGSSSMIGLFQELGPCRVHSDGKAYDNPYSWSNVSNMLFIDQPTQVGFSYSKAISGYTDPKSGYIIQLPNATCPEFASDWGCATYSMPNLTLTANSTPAVAPNMWKTLQGFMGAFPQYSRNGLYFTTESYGGHYAPIINDYILKQNANLPSGAHKINLEGVLIGNGWFDPLIQYQAYYNFSVYPGNTYDYDPFNASVKAQFYQNMYGPGNCLDQTITCNSLGINSVCRVADDFCYQTTECLLGKSPLKPAPTRQGRLGAVDLYENRDEYDIRYLMPDPFPPTYYVDYLNTPKVQAAIGAYVNYTESNSAVSNNFISTGDDDREIGTLAATKDLLANNVTVIMYHGDADYNCNWLGGQVVAHEINATGFDSAGYVNISSSDGVVHGQVKQAGKFAFVRIYESGHEVPFYKPLVSLEMFSRVLSSHDIATGTHPLTPSYRTTGTALSTYREGNFTVQTEILNAKTTDYYYDIVTNLPIFANGSSANTGYVPPHKRDLTASFKRHAAMKVQGQVEVKKGVRVLTREEERRRDRAAMAKRQRWRRRV